MSFECTTTGFSDEEMFEDPEGEDRGGIHSLTETVRIEGNKIIHNFDVSSRYEDRIDENPVPFVENALDAVARVRGRIKDIRHQLTTLETLQKNLEACTEFETNWEGNEDED